MERGSSTAVPLHPEGKVSRISVKQRIQMNKRCEQVWPTLCSAVRVVWLNCCLLWGKQTTKCLLPHPFSLLCFSFSQFFGPCSVTKRISAALISTLSGALWHLALWTQTLR